MKVFYFLFILILLGLNSCYKYDNPLDPKNVVNVVFNPNMVYVPGGTFTMGDTHGQGYSNELPTHSVTLSSFYIGKYEVTQAEWAAIMGSNPAYGYGVGDNYPVYYVSWYNILKYCNLRSVADGLTPVYSIGGSTDTANWGDVPYYESNSTWDAVVCNWSANGYRLPTEAEWEYAARGATNTPDYLYSGSNYINDVAWYGDNSGYTTNPVGTKQANALGLYDMSGNVWDLCWDWYGSYNGNLQSNPTGATSGVYRVLRGGDWGLSALECRITFRGFILPYNTCVVGFRLVRAN